jgi:hypothetical protein
MGASLLSHRRLRLTRRGHGFDEAACVESFLVLHVVDGSSPDGFA